MVTSPGLLISAAHKSSGKTSVSIGLAAALAARGLTVQPFKKGPDYIDPAWLSLAAGRPCRNLDFYTMDRAEILSTFLGHGCNADVALVEGNKGLFDGLDVAGSDSNAALAGMLHLPVVLVIDARGMTRGVAPLLRGYQSFDPDVRIAGVILNKVGGPRHAGKLEAVLERYTDLPLLGVIERSPDYAIVERHLGLVPPNEAAAARTVIERLARNVAARVDLDRILQLAAGARPDCGALPIPPGRPVTRDLRIGIARDAAFGFYYPDDLEAFARAGAELVPIDTLNDRALPDLDGLFIGGGFPETQMAALSANRELRQLIQSAVAGGLPTYAECGGLMYLCRSLTWRGERHEMVGAVPGDAVMSERPVGRGYVRLEPTGAAPWSVEPPGRDLSFAAHEFHYSSINNLPDGLSYAYRVHRGTGIDGSNDGLVLGNLVAGFSHLRSVGGSDWVTAFTRFVRRHKLQAGTAANLASNTR